MNRIPRIKAVRTFIIDGVGSGGDYHNVKGGHWLIDSNISTPMTKWAQFRGSRTSWGINVLGSFCVEIEATDGTKGFATGFGGSPCMLVDRATLQPFPDWRRPRDTNDLFEKMYRASMFNGRKGLPVAVISIELLLHWSRARSARLPASSAPRSPLPHGPDEGTEGLLKNVEYLRQQRARKSVLTSLSAAAKLLGSILTGGRECLSPETSTAKHLLKRAHPSVTFTTGEHEYSRYGFRKLIEGRAMSTSSSPM
ncbi:hypothetical protein N7447_009712 [Penicillium robsamsonii]|uniref:uncharacterized protein n=1 Tax=Penicillium robsamsonii TaxID=1792511 RepID=UPI0025486010|nr:uncharacterized protein N7447_009712 [Penicillium robsamsonii]KAJ5812689.1 hypothetical protein N7447_009712 [Penicillium robsamsonii]